MNSLRYEAQSVLFALKPSRRELLDLSLPNETNRSVSVNVWRNHAFETIMPLIEPYCSFGKWGANFNLGPYDDTFMFGNWQASDVELLWLDSGRFSLCTKFPEWLEWLSNRLGFLRSLSKAPIVLATWTDNEVQNGKLQMLLDQYPATYFADLREACDRFSVELIDQRTASFAGTPISNQAQLILSRELACHWLPAAIFPPIKAVAVDLDETLHSGVLGEDGIRGVQLTPGHAAFQSYIKSIQRQGTFIALVSRNEQQDVEDLFSHRLDYPLRWEDFSTTEVSWGDKAAAIGRITNNLRIAPDAVLFIDDNLGELASVAMRLPQVNTIYAHPDANLTRQVVHYYPGLWRWKIESDDTKRINDLKASVERESLVESIVDPVEYLRSLQVTLSYHYDPKAQLTRLADLCNKTNQFNLALRRFNQVELTDRLKRGDACVASVQLYDRLSDSGIIAVIVAERQGAQLLVEELCVSCRAMGRQLEDTIILIALQGMPIFAGCREVAFRIQHGPRNQPALDWLARLLGEEPKPGLHALSAQCLANFTAAEGVNLVKK